MLSFNDSSRARTGSRRQTLAWATLVTGGLGIYLLGGGRETARAWHLYLGALAAIGAVSLVAFALRGHRSERLPTVVGWARARRRRPVRGRLRSLEELERAAGFSLATAFDVHYRLRPHLVQIAEHRLAVRGVSLQSQPEAAIALLGEPLWDLVRPDRPSPPNRNGRGLPLGDLRDLVAKLEML